MDNCRKFQVLEDDTFGTNDIKGLSKWCGVKCLVVYSSDVKSSCGKVLRKSNTPSKNMHFVREKILLHEPLIRKLVNESFGNFMEGKSLKSNIGSSAQRLQLLKLSRKYRCVLRACIENMQEASRLTENQQQKEYCDNRISVLYNAEFIWHLSEILHVDSIPGDIVLPHLLQWIRFHFPEAEQLATKILNGNIGKTETTENQWMNNVLNTGEYWNTVLGLLLQGNIDPARAILQLHPRAYTAPYKEADKLLHYLPIYTIYGGVSVTEFNCRWKNWQADLKNKIHCGFFEDEKELQTVMKVLSGDGDAINLARKFCSTWYELMIGSLLYTEPMVKLLDLRLHANKYIPLYGGRTNLKLLDTVILALFDGDLNTAMKKLCNTSDCMWTVTHLSNLLYLCGKLVKSQAQNNNAQCNTENLDHSNRPDENAILQYSSMLMKHKSFWQIGIQYLDEAGQQGQDHQYAFFSSVDTLSSEYKIMKIIQAAECRNMSNTILTMCRNKGSRCAQMTRYGDALIWSLRSNDSISTHRIANQMLQNYTKEGIFTAEDLIDNLGSSILISSSLTFLGKYREMHRLYDDGKHRDAADLLIDLVACNIAPKYFRYTLLVDSLLLLEIQDAQGPLFDQQQTSTLLYCLEELIDDKEFNNQPEKIQLIRTAIARNIERCFTVTTAPLDTIAEIRIRKII